jgi:hypothetical protein
MRLWCDIGLVLVLVDCGAVVVDARWRLGDQCCSLACPPPKIITGTTHTGKSYVLNLNQSPGYSILSHVLTTAATGRSSNINVALCW